MSGHNGVAPATVTGCGPGAATLRTAEACA